MKTLYKYTTRGQIQQWQIVAPPGENYFYTIEGIEGGKLTTSEPTYCSGKNLGKSNETTDEQQAQLEAQAKWQKKINSGYNEVLTKEKKFFEPMLAFEFDKYSKLMFTVPTFVQPKLDGVRCYLNDKQLTTRSGKPIESCPHLELPFFGLDGELYSHDLKHDFNKIISLTRKTKLTPEEIKESAEKVQYWVYDYPYASDKVFSKRYEMLKHDFKNFPDSFKLVPTYEIKSMNELKAYHEQFISMGYEGSIVRMDLGGYENKRSKQLLKFKDWQDAEWDIIDITEGEGNRAGCAATVTILVNGTVLCYPTMTGTEEYMRAVWRDRHNIIKKKQATIKFFGYTADGSLRFCTVKTIIDYIP